MENITGWTDKDCEIMEALLEKISGKHSLHLLAVLALKGEKSFGQLRREMSPISAKVLSRYLVKLQLHGIISNRREMQGKVERSFYSIVDKERFGQVLVGLRNFA